MEHNPQDETDPQDSHVELSEASVFELDEKLVQMEMFHNHLPKLEELGYITWDRESGTISKGEIGMKSNHSTGFSRITETSCSMIGSEFIEM